MAERVDKFERLMNLTAILLDAEHPLTWTDLRHRLEGYPDDAASARRQFERDKDDLRELGVPLRIESVAVGRRTIDGYRILKDEYYLPDPGLTREELAALHLATSLVRLEGLRGLEALWKLGGTVAEDGTGDATAAVQPLVADPAVVTLFGAIRARQAVAFRYHDTDREVEPHRLVNDSGRWYVTGFDRSRDADRVFRLDRVEGEARLVGEPGAFERPADGGVAPALEPWLVGEGSAMEARFAVDAAEAPLAVQQLGPEAVETTRPDGSVVLRMEVRNPDGFRSFVLGFLEHAEVLSPPELRAAVADWLREIEAGP
ncbi:MAG TPA: WYL domain-containing protein [Acidimicrobiales bacterium]|jgi:proteasome accessory factor B|nr:WYL domain-containing protein [Acidimicrobiales bacterium]